MKNKAIMNGKARRLGAARLLLILTGCGICLLLLLMLIRFILAQQRPSWPIFAQEVSDDTYILPVPEGRINLNTATSEQLQQLPGIGPALAGAILQYRNEHQSFYFIEELMDVPGIGEKRFEAIKDMICCAPQ